MEGNQELIPSDFEFVMTGPGENSQVPGGPVDDPDPDCPPGSNQPGEVAPDDFSYFGKFHFSCLD